METRREIGWVLAVVALATVGCTGRKQVPFGLEEAGGSGGVKAPSAVEAPEAGPSLPTGDRFDGGQVEVAIEDRVMVVQTGYALAALRLELDGDEATDALVVTATPDGVQLLAGYPRGITVSSRLVDSFLVPDDCVEPQAELQQLSPSLVSARVSHRCQDGTRENLWLLSVEAQPRVRERITVLPIRGGAEAPIEVSVRVADDDADGYDDVIVEATVGNTQVPLTWLNRPGGFARDTSQPEATFEEVAAQAGALLNTDPKRAEALALGVLEAFRALCRESDEARLGLSGTLGVQCGRSASTARASTIAAAAAIRQGHFVRALESQRWWSRPATQPTPEDRAVVEEAWQKARATSSASWRQVDTGTGTLPIYFRDSETLVVGGPEPHTIQLSTGLRGAIDSTEVLPAIRDPNDRFVVTGVRVTCAGFEAEVRPTRGRRTHRVTIERFDPNAPCKTPLDRPARAGEWSILGWAPQGLVAADGDRLRIVPLDGNGKAAGRPFELGAGSPLPAPIRGARITPDGTRYVIAHREGIIVRDWKSGATGLWLRPSDWDGVPGEVRGMAISPDGKRVALQKGNQIRLITW